MISYVNELCMSMGMMGAVRTTGGERVRFPIGMGKLRIPCYPFVRI